MKVKCVNKPNQNEMRKETVRAGVYAAKRRCDASPRLRFTEPASDGSAYRDYVLTAKGRGLFPILIALRQWSEEFDERPAEITTMLVDRESGRPVRKLALHSEDGRTLTAADTALKSRFPVDASG
jgi:hypothetical protein